MFVVHSGALILECGTLIRVYTVHCMTRVHCATKWVGSNLLCNDITSLHYGKDGSLLDSRRLLKPCKDTHNVNEHAHTRNAFSP